MRSSLTLKLAVTLIIMTSMNSYAHRVIEDDGSHTSPENAIVLEDFELSQVVYHEVTETSNQLWFKFDAAVGQLLYWEFGLPALEEFEDYRPVMMILGPNLPPVENVPFEVPEGLGGIRVDGDGAELEYFFERFTATETWIINSEERTVETAGTYYVVAYHPEDTPGKFWVALGKREEFGLSDVLGYADVMYFVRDYHEESAVPLSLLNWGLLILSYAAQIVIGPFLFIFNLFGI